MKIPVFLIVHSGVNVACCSWDSASGEEGILDEITVSLRVDDALELLPMPASGSFIRDPTSSFTIGDRIFSRTMTVTCWCFSAVVTSAVVLNVK